MQPLKTFKNCNDWLMPPKGMEGVGNLPIMRGEDSCERPTVTSAWQLDQEELDALKNNDGVIYLTVWGLTHPPVYISPKHPTDE